MTGLYRIKGTDDFGTVLATDSKGMKIFELKGGGIKVVKADQIEEVFPFTFSVTFLSNNSERANKEYHFLGNQGEVELDDVMVYLGGQYNIGICVVTGVDTKAKTATKTFNGYKLEATKIS